METLIFNLNGKVRSVRQDGTEYLVAPLTMIVEGVLNGSKGPLFYSADEIGKNPAIWNGVPILVNHPNKGSGRSPDVYRKQKIGEVFNTVFSNGCCLVAEGWFDAKATKRIDNRVYEALIHGKQLELSTGLYGDYEPAENGAAYKGKSYTHVIRNFGADHLAILPDQIGACSLRDGCGVLVNERKPNVLRKFAEFLGLISNEAVLTPEQALKILNTEELEQAENTETSESDDPESGSSTTNQKEPEMAFNRKEAIQELVTNCDCWKKKEDQDVLNQLSDEGIEKLQIQNKKHRELVTNAQKAEVENTGDCDEDMDEEEPKKKKPFPPAQNQQSRLTAEEQEDLKFARNERNKQKKILIQKLVNNIEKEEDRVDYVKELATYNIEKLQMLVNLIPARKEPVRNSGRDESEEFVQTFFGDTGPVVNRFGKEEARANAVPVPEWDWQEISNSRNKKS